MSSAARLDLAGLAALVRPRIGLMVLLVTAAGYLLERPAHMGPLLPTLLGTLLVACAGCALNHYLERDADARMERTRRRPLVTGALTERQVLLGAGASLAGGLLILALGAGWPATAFQAAAVLVYLGLYTPLKRRTSTNTWVGAVPGALPVLVGAAAAGGPSRLSWMAFLLIFLWQLPHFFAIASMYREQYRSGGMRVLSGDDPDDALLRWQMPLQVMSVMLVSILPVLEGLTRPLYASTAVLVGLAFLASALAFRKRPDRANARKVVVASVVYLPLVMTALVLDVACSPQGHGPADHAHDAQATAAAACCAEDPAGSPAAGTLTAGAPAGGDGQDPAGQPRAPAAGQETDGTTTTLLDMEGLAMASGPRDADDGTDLPIYNELPDFSLMAEDMTDFTAESMAGQVWVVDFLFTRCGTTCPAMSAVYQDLLKEDLPARFLSVTVDPRNDSPQVLEDYRAKWGGTSDTWRLLTGQGKDIQLLAEGGFKLPVNAGVEPVAGMPPMFHSGKFALVDARGRVRGYYDYRDKLEVDRLREDIRKLAVVDA